MKRLYVVSYDIPHAPRRNRVAQTVLGFGERVQRSVFECWLDEGLPHDLRRRLDKLVKPAEDSVRYYNLGPAQQLDVEVQGLGRVTEDAKVFVCRPPDGQ